MARVTDEMLMAYADGELSKQDAELVERLLREGDVESREAVDEFRKTAALVRAAFADDTNDPISETLVETVLATKATPKPAAVAGSRSRPARRERYAMAMAACLAAAVVVGGLATILRPLETVTAASLQLGPIDADSRLAHVLAKVPASTLVEIDDDNAGAAAHLMVVSTFYDRYDRICREVELMDSALAPQQVAVACHTPDSSAWSVEGVARIATASDPSSSGYAPAGAPEQDALKSLQIMVGAKEPLSADEERRLIDAGWK